MPLPCIHKSVLGVNGAGTVRPYMRQGEQEVLLALVESVAPKIMIEIGVQEGRTAQAVLRCCDSIEMYVGVDVPYDYHFELPAQACEWTDRPGHLVRHDPRFSLALRGEVMPRCCCDVVFIDGDHGKNAVREDSDWAAETVLPGGIIIWHDYGNSGVQVTEVLDQLHAEGRNIRSVGDTWLAFERRR